MNTRLILFFFTFFLGLIACTPAKETAVSPTPLPATATTLSTATAVLPTATTLPAITRPISTRDLEPPELIGSQPTAVVQSTPTPETSFCPVNTTEVVSPLPVPPDVARILFLNDDLWLWREETGTAEALTSGGNVTAYQPAPDYQTITYLQAGDLWLWRSGQTAVRLTEAVEIADFIMTPDGQVIAYRRLVTEDEHELWSVRSDGSSPRLLAQPSAAETRSQFPDAVSIDLHMGWVQESHILAYNFNPTLPGIGDPPSVPSFWVDADTGQPLTVPPPAAAPETHSGYRLEMTTTPEYNNDIQLIDSNGRVVLTLTSPYQYTWSFSPDDRYLIVAVMEGAVIVDLTDLSQQPIPVPFRGLGFGHGGMGLPPSWWLDNHTWLAVVPDDGDVSRIGATFTLWQVDVAAGTAGPLANLPGHVMTAALSPDQQVVAYMDMKGNLHLYYLATGQDLIYDSGSGIWFDHWLDDSGSFIYSDRSSDGTQICFLLGQTNQPPVPLSFLENGNPEWLDKTRFVLTSIGYSTTSMTGTIYFQSLPGELIFVGEVNGPAPGQRPFSDFRVYFETP